MSEQAYRAHPMSIVDPDCEIGSGTRIWAGTHVMCGARIGEGCNIGENCFIEGGVVVGSHVTVKNNVALYDGAVVEDDVFLGPSCVFTNVVNPRAFVSRPKGGQHRSKRHTHLRAYRWALCFCGGRRRSQPGCTGLCAGIRHTGQNSRMGVQMRLQADLPRQYGRLL